jgi:hypothetical protein
MSPRKEAPDVDRLARSMLLLHGVHDDDDHTHGELRGGRGTWSKAPTFGDKRAEELREATARDRERYLTSGLVSVDCRFCHVAVDVKKLGPGHTSVQWNSEATRRCAYFADIRESGGEPARTPSCPRLADSIKHAVAEGCLEEMSTAPPAGDG